MNNCKYCNQKTIHEFCKPKCSESYKRKIDNDLMAVGTPSFINKNYNEKEESLIKKYIKGLTAKERREKLPVTGGSCD